MASWRDHPLNHGSYGGLVVPPPVARPLRQVAWASFGHHLEVLAQHHQALLNQWWQLLLLKCFACNWLSTVDRLVDCRERERVTGYFWVCHWILFGDSSVFSHRKLLFSGVFSYQTPTPSWDPLTIQTPTEVRGAIFFSSFRATIHTLVGKQNSARWKNLRFFFI